MLSNASVQAGGLRWHRSVLDGLRVFVKDVGNGMLEVSHNLLALVGLAVVAIGLFLAGQPGMRAQIESRAFGWLQDRHESRQPPSQQLAQAVAQPEAVVRATAIDPATLDRQQKLVAQWLSRRYRVAPEPVGRLVQEAWSLGAKAGLEPHLILAIMAIESSFNPFAQSPVGAQGLMQVMTRVHDDKFEAFGGTLAAFDPVANLRVGVQILRDCIAKAGSLEGGLRFYVGAANLPDDGGYAARVLAERDHLKKVSQGQTVPFNVPLTVALAAPVATPDAVAVLEPSKGAPAAPAAVHARGPLPVAMAPVPAHPFDPGVAGAAGAASVPGAATASIVPTATFLRTAAPAAGASMVAPVPASPVAPVAAVPALAATPVSDTPPAARPLPPVLPHASPASVPTAAEPAPARVAGL